MRACCCCRCCLELGLYLVLTSLPFGRPKRDLGERLRRLDVDERIRVRRAGPAGRAALFASRLLENMLRPDRRGRWGVLRASCVRLGLGGGRELEARLRVVRPGVEVVAVPGRKSRRRRDRRGDVSAHEPAAHHVRSARGRCGCGWSAFGVGFVLPDWDLQRRAARRRGLVLMELPTILDMLTLATSAGMALEQALEEVARQSDGVVAHELRLVARELALGQRRNLPEALDGLAERLGTPEVDHILGRMSAAYEQGLPLGQALTAHAQALRERQRLHMVEEGGKTACVCSCRLRY